MSPPNERLPRHLDVIDGLRGLAIALVLWFHVWQISWLPATLTLAGRELSAQWIPETGFLGVELFFFISGFCLFVPHARHRFDGARLPALTHFAYRRAIKIVPSYVLVIALSLLFGAQHFASAAEAWRHILTHLLFIHIWYADTFGSIDGVLWSLGVEVQFYVLFPVLAWALSRRPLIVCAALCAVALAYRAAIEGCCAYYERQLLSQLPAYLDLFAAGMLAAFLVGWTRARPALGGRVARAGATVVALAGFAALIALLRWQFAVRYEPDALVRWPADHRTLLALSFIAIAAGSSLGAARWQRALANPPLVFLAAISYNLYLWHQAAARFLFARHWPAPRTPDGHDDPHWQLVYTLLAIGTAIVVGTLATYVVERPLLRWNPPWLRAHTTKYAGSPGEAAEAESLAGAT